MAQDNRFDLTRLEQVGRRLQVLEDAEAIRHLKARYAALCDNQYDADGIASLFSEGAVWESPALGCFEGRDAIRNFFRFMPCTVALGNQAMWRAGIDHETYARVAGIWMFRHKRTEPLMSVPFDTRWATARLA